MREYDRLILMLQIHQGTSTIERRIMRLIKKDLRSMKPSQKPSRAV